MASPGELADRPLLIAAGVLVVGAVGAGAGFVNGDAAVYTAQAWAGDVWSRPVHLGYHVLGAALAPLALDRLPVAMDLVTAMAAAAIVLLSAACARGERAVAALAAAAAVLPHASCAEVDLPWTAAALAAVVVKGVWGPLCLGVAVCISPTALLAVPAVCMLAGRWRPYVGTAVVVVAGLTVLSSGAWWVGPRGVLTAGPWLPGRVLEAWMWGIPLGLVPLAAGPRLTAVLPLLLAPADVASAVFVACVVGIEASVGWQRSRRPALFGAILAAHVGLGLVGWRSTVARVRAEHRQIVAVVADWQPGDGLVAVWSWGARASVVATGTPYGLRWRSHDRLLPDQRVAWCAPGEVLRVVVLPPTLDLRARRNDKGRPKAACEASGADGTRTHDL